MGKKVKFGDDMASEEVLYPKEAPKGVLYPNKEEEEMQHPQSSSSISIRRSVNQNKRLHAWHGMDTCVDTHGMT